MPDIEQKKDIKRQITRTIVELPKEKIVYRVDTIFKDTTIIRRGKVVNLSVNYDSAGKIDKAACEADGGKVTKENIKENIKEQNHTEYVNKKNLFLYGLSFGIFLIVFMVLLIKK